MTTLSDRPSQTYKGSAPGFLWGIGCIVLMFSPFFIGFSDDVAVLYPERNNLVPMVCVAGGFGLLSMAVGLYFFRNAPARWVLAVLLFLIGGAAAAGLTWCVATRLERAHDFPRDRVQTTRQLVAIVTATRTIGSKGRVDRALILPQGWPTVGVRGEDYSFMLRYRPPSSGTTPDRIESNGFFCAIVTVELTPTAKRIAGLTSHTLPVGSVSFCPARQDS